MKIDDNLLRNELRHITANCDECDIPQFSCDRKKPCKYGISDEKIEEIINNSMEDKEMENKKIDTDNLKLIDFYKNEGNTYSVTLYFGDTECEDYWGDDWNDTPYEHNAGTVYDEFVEKTEVVRVEDGIIIEPSDTPEAGSRWNKRDFKNRLTPCLLIVPKTVLDKYYKDEFPSYEEAIGNPFVRRIYYNDSYPQVMNTINSSPSSKPKEEEKVNEIHGIDTTPSHILKWIDHLLSDEMHIPLYLRDEENNYYDLKSFHQELIPTKYGLPPNHCFIGEIKKYKTPEETRKELEIRNKEE